METIIIVIHLMIVLALVGVVLLQRSEGGGLGIGGGSGFMTARGAANALTRATAILATAFFISSLALSLLARYYTDRPTDILDRLPTTESQPATGTTKGVLDQLGGQAAPTAAEPAAPQPGAASTTPAAPQSGTAQTTPATPAPAQTAPAQPATPAVPNN